MSDIVFNKLIALLCYSGNVTGSFSFEQLFNMIS